MTSLYTYALTQHWPDVGDSVRRLNGYLRDEIAAGVAYGLVADRIAGTRDVPYLGLLRQFQEEHDLTADALRQHIAELGGDVEDTEGALGPWASAVHCTATLFHEPGQAPAALECLRDGELHSLESLCTDAPRLDSASGQLFQNLLIPTQRRHVRILNELLGGG